MADDRVDGSSLPLTHEFLSLMLGVRRAGVTEALHALESKGLISSTRGAILVRNRKGKPAPVNNSSASSGARQASWRQWLAWAKLGEVP
jgi:DNA-binding FadR family transcriptional regulator